MKVSRFVIIALSCLLWGGTSAAQQDVLRIASSFLPPNTQFARLERFDSQTGKSTKSSQAILTGHFVSPESDDLVFAYANSSQDSSTKALFVAVLHKASDGYAKVFERSYYERFLWVQDFATVGLKIIRLPGDSKDSLIVATSRGASLGVQVEMYRWADGLGMTNVMPDHPSAHRVSFTLDKDQFQLKLSFEKFPGERGVPEPILFKWDGRQLTHPST